MTIGLVVLLVGIERRWWWAIALGLILVTAFIWRSHRIPHALIPWRVLGQRTAVAASLVALLIGLVQFSMLTYLPLLSQKAASDLNSGVVVVPLTVLWLTMGSVTGVLALRIGIRSVVLIGVILSVGASGVLVISDALPSLLVASTLIGAAAGFVLIPTLLATQHAVARADVGAATSMMVLSRNFGGAVGAALTAVLIAGLTVQGAFAILAAVAAAALLPGLRLPSR